MKAELLPLDRVGELFPEGHRPDYAAAYGWIYRGAFGIRLHGKQVGPLRKWFVSAKDVHCFIDKLQARFRVEIPRKANARTTWKKLGPCRHGKTRKMCSLCRPKRKCFLCGNEHNRNGRNCSRCANRLRDRANGEQMNYVGMFLDWEFSGGTWKRRAEMTVPPAEQRTLTFRGETKKIAEWAKETGLPVTAIAGRIRMGWSLRKTLTTPARARDAIYKFRGKAQSLYEWATELHIHPQTLYNRLYRGLSVREMLTKPGRKRYTAP